MSSSPTLQSISLEFRINTSPSLLYAYVSEPVRLQEWFADDVSYDEQGNFMFRWTMSDEKQVAEIIDFAKGEFIRFHWLDSPEDSYLEFRIVTTDLSKQTILVIEDFVPSDEVTMQQQLWESQVKELMHILGN